jgi:Spy/CpxP family protein refolding chaperone
MKRWTSLCCAALLAAMVGPASCAEATAPAEKPAEAPKTESAAPAAANPEAPKPEKAPAAEGTSGELKGDLAMLAKECQLSDEQVAKIGAAVAAAMAEVGQWQQANAEKLAALQKAADAAREARDPVAMQKVMTDAQPVLRQQADLLKKSQKAILNVLTPEQRQKWMGFVAYRQFITPLARAGLTPEQSAKIRELCNGAAKEADGIKEEDPAAAQTEAAIFGKVILTIRDEVLTAEQRAIVMPPTAAEPPPAPPAAAAPPAAEAKPAPAPETKPAPEKK